MADFEAARHNMVDCQIRTNKVTDRRLIEAMREIPRERFVDAPQQAIAYIDGDLPLGNGRYLMEPMVLARMLQGLDIGPEDAVLDIGAATGYSSAVIARLALAVIALEPDGGMTGEATAKLADLGIDNVAFVDGTLNQGYPAQAPYDVILFQGAVAEVPQGILDQLAEGGRLCAVIDEGAGPGRVTLMVKSGGVVSGRVVFDANVAPLPGFEKTPGFVF